MAVPDIRQRTGYLFLFVLIGHVILISAQVNTRSGVKVLEAVTFGVFSELQRASGSVFSGLGGVWGEYVALKGVREENEGLRRQLGALQIELQKQKARALQGARLQELLGFRDRLDLPTLAAEVIGADATLGFQTITIDRGSTDGIARDMAVLAPSGIVGRIVKPGARAAMVQLLIDREAAAGALIERSRAGGVIVGGKGDPPLEMLYVSNLADVKQGDKVLTSGVDGIYPKGFVVGWVESVQRGTGLYKLIRVRPAIDFSKLEEVLVVLSPPQPAAPEAPQ
jgi:rod shape-determining protein MreC